MNFKRAATYGVSGGVLAAMLAGAATSGRRASIAVPVEKSSAADVSGAELAAEIARLRERLRPSATPQQTRNLFEFSRGGAPHGVEVRPADAGAVVPASSSVQRPAAAIELIGVAEDPGADGPTRTAILSASGALYLAKEGEPITTRYRVAKIAGDAVELIDVLDGTPLRLALK
jgi:hypothetical protein